MNMFPFSPVGDILMRATVQHIVNLLSASWFTVDEETLAFNPLMVARIKRGKRAHLRMHLLKPNRATNKGHGKD